MIHNTFVWRTIVDFVYDLHEIDNFYCMFRICLYISPFNFISDMIIQYFELN